MPEPVHNKKTYKPDSSKKREIDKFFMQMIVQDLQSFSVVDDNGFRHLVSALELRYETPSQ